MYAIATIILSFPFSAWLAYAMQINWGWFITPLFGMAPPSIWHLAGLLTIVSTATMEWGKPARYDDSMEDRFAWFLTVRSLVPLFMLGFGWVYKNLGGL